VQPSNAQMGLYSAPSIQGLTASSESPRISYGSSDQHLREVLRFNDIGVKCPGSHVRLPARVLEYKSREALTSLDFSREAWITLQYGVK